MICPFPLISGKFFGGNRQRDIYNIINIGAGCRRTNPLLMPAAGPGIKTLDLHRWKMKFHAPVVDAEWNDTKP